MTESRPTKPKKVLRLATGCGVAVWVVAAQQAPADSCPHRHMTVDSIKSDLSGRDAAILGMALNWKHTCWNDQPEWVRQLVLNNTLEGDP